MTGTDSTLFLPEQRRQWAAAPGSLCATFLKLVLLAQPRGDVAKAREEEAWAHF